MIHAISMIALAALALAPAPQAEAQAPLPQNVLVVLAHPDDELTMAPALAALARQGHKVALMFATLGDQGPGVTELARGAALGEIRRREATCSAQALGVQARFLGLGDGTLTDAPQRPDSPARRFSNLFAAEYLGSAPALVLTWGPDGGYGHGDHRMVSALATQAVQAMPADARPALLYVGIPAGSLPPVPEMADWATTDPALLAETIAYTPADLEAAKAAAQCHVTQFDDATRAGMMPLFDATIWQGEVHFRPAF